jgi:hypothetical protein
MNKTEIIAELELVHNQLWTLVENMPMTVQALSLNNKWTPVQNVEHINKSIAPLVRYLGTPKNSIEEKFGLTSKASFELEDLNKIYAEAIQNGVVNSEAFKPSDESSSFMDLKMAGIELLSKMKSLLDEWSEDELNKYVCPHPLLGKLSVREMLYFTIFHCQTHSAIIHLGFRLKL